MKNLTPIGVLGLLICACCFASPTLAQYGSGANEIVEIELAPAGPRTLHLVNGGAIACDGPVIERAGVVIFKTTDGKLASLPKRLVSDVKARSTVVRRQTVRQATTAAPAAAGPRRYTNQDLPERTAADDVAPPETTPQVPSGAYTNSDLPPAEEPREGAADDSADGDAGATGDDTQPAEQGGSDDDQSD